MELLSLFNSFKLSIITYLNVNYQFFGAPNIKGPVFDKCFVASSYHKSNNPPITISGQKHWKFDRVKEVFYPETFISFLKMGRVWGNEGYVISAENVLFDEVSRHYNDVNRELSIFKLGKIIEPIYKNATVAVISAAGAHVYYHWMIDIVSRVNLLIENGCFDSIDYFVLDYTGLSFQKELLKKLNIEESKIIPSNGFNKFHLQARELVIPSYVSPNDAPSIKACYFLRSLFKNDLIKNNHNRKLYLQRKKGRKVVNEEELMKFLLEQNFEVVQAENISVSQQAQLFSEASFIIAPHGAGLTNLVFCEPGTKVIDLFAPEWVNPCYWILSSHLNLIYSYLIGKAKELPKNYDPVGKTVDITVDMLKFNKLFSLVNDKSIPTTFNQL